MHDFKRFLIETQTVVQFLSSPSVKDKVQEARATAAEVMARYAHLFQPKVAQLVTNYLTMMALSSRGPGTPSGMTSRYEISSAMSKWGDFIAAQQNNGQFISKLNTVNYTPQMLTKDAEEWHEELAQRQRGAGPEGRTVLTLDHIGWKGWKWISLDKGYCKREGDSMGHCGNVGYKPGDNILSLRDPQGFPHLTFIINTGILGESKGRANSKPSAKYHPPIIELLKSPMIKSIRGGGYVPENNFHLKDLPPNIQKELTDLKPDIDFINFALRSQSPKLVGDVLNARIKRVSKNTITIDEYESWKDLYEELKNSDVEDFSWLEDPVDMFWSDYHPPVHDILDHVSEDNKEKITKYLKAVAGYSDEDSLADAASEDDDINSALMHAYKDGEIYGTEAEALKDVKKQLDSPTDNGFYIDFSRHPYALKITKEAARGLLDRRMDEIEQNGLLSLLDFSYSQPYNGYSDFDSNIFNDRLSELLSELPDPDEKVGQGKFDFAT
jgi:hypothetical protein